MIVTLDTLFNTTRPDKTRRRVGRGTGSKRGKTSGRGHKGDKSRSGYKRRYGKEGGQLPLYMRLPTRGFSNSRFRKEVYSINLGMIEAHFNDGEVVNLETLVEKGFISKNFPGTFKVLSEGEISKKITIEAQAFSQGAIEKLEKANVSFKQV